MEQKNRAALYLRLSKEDKDKLIQGDDSASIRNQRLLLIDYALKRDYEIVGIYSDDDESGLFDTRPEFERMLRDAQAGRFDIVIAKSQSRFSRNIEHVEKYLHHYFPNMGIRFIGVVDGADTSDAGNKKSRQINGLVNEWYCEDLSANIRSAFKAKMKNGQYLGASCPYGYVKDPKNHNHLIIDEYAADVVRRIYRLYLQGYGKAKIGRILTEQGILIPTLYKREVLGIHYHNSHELATTRAWSYQTIHTILNNEVYIGNIVQNKSTNLSYKEKKHVRQPEDSWIRVTGVHEAIIDPNTFKKAQERQKIRTKTVNTDSGTGLFSGIVFCADCKHAMVRAYERRGHHKFTGYCCKTYKTQGRRVCTSHAVNYEQLKKTVLSAVKSEARRILTPDDIRCLSKVRNTGGITESIQTQICHMEKETARREIYKKRTYLNYMDGIISKEDYLSYMEEFNLDISKYKGQLAYLQKQLMEQKKQNDKYDMWAEDFKNYINIDELTRGIVLELIEKIEVNEDGSINLFYKFRNSCTD